MSQSITRVVTQKTSVYEHLCSVFKRLQLMLDKQHQRKQLAELTLEQLTDMGIDPAAAGQEMNKPFWK